MLSLCLNVSRPISTQDDCEGTDEFFVATNIVVITTKTCKKFREALKTHNLSILLH